MPFQYCVVTRCGQGRSRGDRFCEAHRRKYDLLLKTPIEPESALVTQAIASIKAARESWSGHEGWLQGKTRGPVQWPDCKDFPLVCVRSFNRASMATRAWTVRNLKRIHLVFFILLSPADPELEACLENIIVAGLLDFVLLGLRGADRIVVFADKLLPCGRHLLMLDDNISKIGLFRGRQLRAMTRVQFLDVCKAGWQSMKSASTNTWAVNICTNGDMFEATSDMGFFPLV